MLLQEAFMAHDGSLVERAVSLEAWRGGPQTPGVAVLAIPDGSSRLRSAGIALGLGVLLALVFLPIPIVHFAGVPLALLGGLVIAARRLAPGARLRTIRGACPHCGHEQSFYLGPSWKRGGVSRQLVCERCAQTLAAVEADGADVT
jgi:hypothetical protein